VKPPKISTISLDLIDPPDLQLRDSMDPQKLRDLADSIAKRGLINPIQLRPTNGRYAIVAGHRRYVAHQDLHRTHIPAVILDATQAEALATSLHENLFREDLTPLEEAALIAHLLDGQGLDPPTIARALGHTLTWVESRAALLTYPPALQQALHAGTISLAAARLLSQILDPNHLATALEAARTHGMTERNALEWVRQFELYQQARATGATPALPDPSLVASEAAKTVCDFCRAHVYINITKFLRICFTCLEALTAATHPNT